MNNQSFVINAYLSEPHLIQILVENLANCHIVTKRCGRQTPVGWRAMDTVSLECFATVDLEIQLGKEYKKMPVSNCFVFTCNRNKGTGYNLAWICSLS